MPICHKVNLSAKKILGFIDSVLNSHLGSSFPRAVLDSQFAAPWTFPNFRHAEKIKPHGKVTKSFISIQDFFD